MISTYPLTEVAAWLSLVPSVPMPNPAGVRPHATLLEALRMRESNSDWSISKSPLGEFQIQSTRFGPMLSLPTRAEIEAAIDVIERRSNAAR